MKRIQNKWLRLLLAAALIGEAICWLLLFAPTSEEPPTEQKSTVEYYQGA